MIPGPAVALCASLLCAPPLVVGDSLAYSARHQLAARGITVDAEPGRRMTAAPRILAHHPPRYVVLELANNGRLRLSTCKRAVRAARGPVWLVTNTRHARNNRVLRRCDLAFPPRRVHLIRWHRVVALEPGYVKADGVHLTRQGKREFARMIARTVTTKEHTWSR